MPNRTRLKPGSLPYVSEVLQLGVTLMRNHTPFSMDMRSIAAGQFRSLPNRHVSHHRGHHLDSQQLLLFICTTLPENSGPLWGAEWGGSAEVFK